MSDSAASDQRKRERLRKLRRDRRQAFVMGLDALVRKLDAEIAWAEAESRG